MGTHGTDRSELQRRLATLSFAALERLVTDLRVPVRLGRMPSAQAAERILAAVDDEGLEAVARWLDAQMPDEAMPEMVGGEAHELVSDARRSGREPADESPPVAANGGHRPDPLRGGGEAPVPRSVQLRFFADGAPRHEALPPNRAVRIDVFIGPRLSGTHAAPGPVDEGALGFEDGEAAIDVVLFVKAGAQPGVWSQRLRLPRSGPSTPASFEIQTLDGTPVRANLELHHRGRILQSLTLRASVDEEDFGRIQLDWASVSRAPGSLSTRSDFDAALSDTGAGLVLSGGAHTDADPVAIEVGGMEGLFAKLDAVLAGLPGASRAAGSSSSEPTTNDLRSAETQAALHELATQGHALYRKILARAADETALRARLTAVRRLQLASAVQGDVLPIELCYDLNQPYPDAPLCAGAERALRTGTCDADCGRDGKHICPLGFWGLRMVIERQVKTVSGSGDFVLSTVADDRQRRIHPLNATLFAASSRVDNQVDGGRAQVEDACRELATGLGATAKRVDTWSDWRAEVDGLQPRLMVMLPHVEQPRPDAPPEATLQLEIGDRQLLQIDRLRKTDVVHVPAGVDEVTYQGYGNVVLLIGCETSRQRTYEQVIEQFQQQGAKVIFATLNRIMGRHAAPLAARLVRSFAHDRAQGVGEHLLAFRRAMMLEGYPSAMGIVGFGDADWTVG